ncbi:MAG: DNA recombination protein RmuC [Bacteroidia bacterium]|nr:DNA recombination protein RmuC [Bacteroidia bacterium]
MITIISLILTVLCIILLVVLLVRKPASGNDSSAELNNFRNEMLTQMRDNRSELNSTISDFRKELRDSMQGLNDQNRISLEKLGEVLETRLTALINKNDEQLEKVNLKLEQKLEQVNLQTRDENKTLRESQEKSLREFQERFDKNVASFNDLQREKFSQLDKQQKELIQSTENKLEQMRVTVDEKLQKTLNERLGQSFELVSKQLGEVQKGLGEMQTLAQDVGGLKKVLSNVKTRGGIGEVQLSMLLEQILAPEQYQANVKTKKGSADLVEFAIKLPGKNDDGNPMWLPVDAKFPQDMFARLQEAYETGDPLQVEKESKALENTVKIMAKDIRDKYLDPPNTTDFAIMFLPFENIYAEIIRKAGFVDMLMRDYKIVVTGPTTFAAILNSLQMGFRTLAIQKRSSEVWEVLKAVKTEFGTFSAVLAKAQEKIIGAHDEIDKLVGVRSRAINRKLREVETLNPEDAGKIIGEGDSGIETE